MTPSHRVIASLKGEAISFVRTLVRLLRRFAPRNDVLLQLFVLISLTAAAAHGQTASGAARPPAGQTGPAVGQRSNEGADRFFYEGLKLYQAGRWSEATETFEKALKHRQRSEDAQRYIERIRRETVDRLRNKALMGLSKNDWKNKFYFVTRSADGRVRVGISVQEVFDRDSTVFRTGAVEALQELSGLLEHSASSSVVVSLISEAPLTETSQEAEVISQQVATLFSFLSQSAKNALPKL